MAKYWPSMIKSKVKVTAQRGRMVKRYLDYKLDLAYCAKCLEFEMRRKVDLIQFHIPMSKTAHKRRPEIANQPHLEKPDLDNLIKGFLDAFKKEDDCKIWTVKGEKFWTPREKGQMVVYVFDDVERNMINEVIKQFPIITAKDSRYVSSI